MRPAKANAPLVVYADAVLAFSVAVERFEAIAGRRLQEIEGCGRLQLREFSGRYIDDRVETLRLAGFEELASMQAPEALDHPRSL